MGGHVFRIDDEREMIVDALPELLKCWGQMTEESAIQIYYIREQVMTDQDRPFSLQSKPSIIKTSLQINHVCSTCGPCFDNPSKGLWVNLQLSAAQRFNDPSEARLLFYLTSKRPFSAAHDFLLPFFIVELDLHRLIPCEGDEIRIFSANELMHQSPFEVAKVRNNARLLTGGINAIDIQGR